MRGIPSSLIRRASIKPERKRKKICHRTWSIPIDQKKTVPKSEGNIYADRTSVAAAYVSKRQSISKNARHTFKSTPQLLDR